MTGKITRPPFAREASVDLVFDQAAAIAQEIGFKLETAPPVGGGSDGNFTVAMGIPTLDGLGVDGDGAHTNDEYLQVFLDRAAHAADAGIDGTPAVKRPVTEGRAKAPAAMRQTKAVA